MPRTCSYYRIIFTFRWQMDAYFANGTGWGIVEQSQAGVDTHSDMPPDQVFLARAKAAYGAIKRADGPTARWIYQSWALRESDSGMNCGQAPCPSQLSRLHGFSSAAGPGNFILLDMTHNSVGMWRDPWKGSWGLPFIWTALPDYGDAQYMSRSVLAVRHQFGFVHEHGCADGAELLSRRGPRYQRQ